MKHARRGGEGEADALHELRIRVKKLRYACGFFRELLGRPGRRVARRLGRIQDALGCIRDHQVLADFLAAMARRAGRTAAHGDGLPRALSLLARRHRLAAEAGVRAVRPLLRGKARRSLDAGCARMLARLRKRGAGT